MAKMIRFKTLPLNTLVHTISRKPHHKNSTFSTEYLTTSFTSVLRKDTYNVLTAYVNDYEANQQQNRIQLTNKDNDNDSIKNDYQIKQFQIDELSYLAFVLKMPLLVYITRYCNRISKYEIIEVYYKNCENYTFLF